MSFLPSSLMDTALRAALREAALTVGSTAPNPPVGAAALGADGAVISAKAHLGAGTPHAEARVLEDCRTRGILDQVKALAVTLEPCNHHGRTPPCSEAILGAPGIRQVHIGVADPNPRVAGGGAARLRAAGLEVSFTDAPELRSASSGLIESFAYWARTGLPWVVVKQAIDLNGSMIPAVGQKTFTSPDSLRFAHELRRRADAILTGSGTILADRPQLTVRHVADHPGKRRWLAILDRRGRVSNDYLNEARGRGFEVLRPGGLEEALRELGRLGALECLVEAGPELTRSVLEGDFWNRHVVIRRANPSDLIEDVRNPKRT